MKRIYLYLFIICMAHYSVAQGKVNVLVPHTQTVPEIDGVIDVVWDDVPAVPIENDFKEELPTVTAYWKALWDNDALYVLISVEDDDHWPSWKSGGSWYEYDQPEVYLDINDILNDGVGPGGKGNGHYQTLSSFTEGGSGVLTDLPFSNYRPGGKYCYVVTGENYVIEFALDYTSFVNIDAVTMSFADFQALDSIGFDVCIIDQDEDITTERQRAVWQNIGLKDENYNNMDDAGSITLVEKLPEGIYSPSVVPVSVYPNPASKNIMVNAEFDKLIISDICGTKIKTVETSNKRLNIEMLHSGIYFIQVISRDKIIGTRKFIKK